MKLRFLIMLICIYGNLFSQNTNCTPQVEPMPSPALLIPRLIWYNQTATTLNVQKVRNNINDWTAGGMINRPIVNGESITFRSNSGIKAVGLALKKTEANMLWRQPHSVLYGFYFDRWSGKVYPMESQGSASTRINYENEGRPWNDNSVFKIKRVCNKVYYYMDDIQFPHISTIINSEDLYFDMNFRDVLGWVSDVTIYGACGVQDSAASLVLASGSTNQTVDTGIAISSIAYTFGNGATGVAISGLPTGVNSVVNGTSVTISGTPTVAGTFNYTVSTTGGCGTAGLQGTINVSTPRDWTLAPNSYIFDPNNPNHKDGLYIPVDKAYAMWNNGVHMGGSPIPSGTATAEVYWEDVSGLIKSDTYQLPIEVTPDKGTRIKVEVKTRTKDKIDAPTLRAFIGGLRDYSKGIFVSTTGFTKEAKYESERANFAITLIELVK